MVSISASQSSLLTPKELPGSPSTPLTHRSPGVISAENELSNKDRNPIQKVNKYLRYFSGMEGGMFQFAEEGKFLETEMLGFMKLKIH